MSQSHFVVDTHSYNASFRTGELTYAITLGLDSDLSDLQALLEDLIDDAASHIEARIGQSLCVRDRMRCIMLGDSSERTMSTVFTNATSFTALDVVAVVEECLEQYGQFPEESTFTLEKVMFSYIIAPLQSGCSTAGLSTKPDAAWYKEHATSVVCLTNTDNMCAARSLVILAAQHAHTVLNTVDRPNRRELCWSAHHLSNRLARKHFGDFCRPNVLSVGNRRPLRAHHQDAFVQRVP